MKKNHPLGVRTRCYCKWTNGVKIDWLIDQLSTAFIEVGYEFQTAELGKFIGVRYREASPVYFETWQDAMDRSPAGFDFVVSYLEKCDEGRGDLHLESHHGANLQLGGSTRYLCFRIPAVIDPVAMDEIYREDDTNLQLSIEQYHVFKQLHAKLDADLTWFEDGELFSGPEEADDENFSFGIAWFCKNGVSKLVKSLEERRWPSSGKIGAP